MLAIALLVLGPKRLPEVGRSLGKGLRDFKEAISGEDHPRPDELGTPAAAVEVPPQPSMHVAPEPAAQAPPQSAAPVVPPQSAAPVEPQPPAEPAPAPVGSWAEREHAG